MGGFHLLLNYLKAVGKIMDSSGLKEIMVQAKVLLPGTCEKVFHGKGYLPSYQWLLHTVRGLASPLLGVIGRVLLRSTRRLIPSEPAG